ncbi:hypothetical protein SY83_21670 [Paenibacillus swuensis]|uniref:N-acetyltransferase domain-containing protein n=1 Tax=Paenibacillus swuensis TaxID=1178515 RepID=A0A172TQ14_9BACL|nr:hypothetical protein SY83_21670 [Paenibacillus swuensis]
MQQFAKRHGDGRITRGALRLAEAALADSSSSKGNQLLLMSDQGDIAGVSLVLGYGEIAAIVIVHSEYRGRRVAPQLISRHVADLGAYTCNVAVHNTPSLKMCFRAGLTAVGLFTGPTGVPTLRFIHPGSFVTSTNLNQSG